MQFVQRWSNVGFKGATKIVDQILPSSTVAAIPKEPDRRPFLNRAWSAAKPVSESDPVGLYLRKRGLKLFECDEIRTSMGIGYFEHGKKIATYPAMLARVRDASGAPKTLHVTYLDGKGNKADVSLPKKLMSAVGSGAHVRLCPIEEVHDELNVTEGIETAMAVRDYTAQPTWSLISAGGFKSFSCPESVDALEIWSDNDATFTGQAAAYLLANRIVASVSDVRVRVPLVIDTDWADTLPLL